MSELISAISVTHRGHRDTVFNMLARRLAALFLLAATLLPFCSGCGSRKLETGYQYTPLGASPAQRRAYYAGPFSPEARNAMMSEDNGGARRPGN